MATTSYLGRLPDPLTDAFTPHMASALLELRADSELENCIGELRRKANDETLTPAPAESPRPSLRDLGFAGMWADRDDIKDGVSYVNALRDRPRPADNAAAED